MTDRPTFHRTQFRERVDVSAVGCPMRGGYRVGVHPMSNVTSSTATKSAAKPVHIPAAMSAAWRSAFGDATCPAYIVGIAGVVNRAYRAVPAANRSTADFDTWIAAIRAADKRDAPDGPAHRFTNGSGRDIARTQNAIYVACAVSGIAADDITNAFGMAMWDHIINRTNTCNYRTKPYWRSAMADFVNGRHNDVYALPLDAARTAVRLWRDAERADTPTTEPTTEPTEPAASEPAAS